MTARVTSPLFIGRGSELAALADAVTEADAGRPVGVLLSGEAGVGKSRLLDEFARRADARGVQTVLGNCVEAAEGELPYAPFSAALRALAGGLDDEELDRVLGPARAGLGLLVPDLAGAPNGADALGQARLFDLLLAALGRLSAERPVVLVLEDIQWADTATRSLMRFLIRTATNERLAIVATYRSDELHRRHPLRPYIGELDREPRVRRIALEPFSRAEIAEQVGAIRGATADPRVVDRLFDRSEGNAFFTEELLAAAETGELPDSLRDVLLVRLERLSEPAQRIVRAAAAAGRSVDHRLLGAVVGDTSLDALREAVAEQVLVTRGQAYEFRHALLRETAYEDLLPGEREELHLAIARALQAQPELAGSETTLAAELAHHWLAGREPKLAIPASITAGREAERVYAYAEAQGHYERALTVWDSAPDQELDRAELTSMAARAASLAGNLSRAAALARGALELIDADVEPVRASLQYAALGRYLEDSGSETGAAEAFSRARELMPSEPTAERGRVVAAEARRRALNFQAEVARPLADEALAIGRSVGARDVEASALSTLVLIHGIAGTWQEGIPIGHEAIAIAEELGDSEELMRAYTNTAQIIEESGDLETALEVTLDGVDTARRIGGEHSWGGFLIGEAGARLVRLGRLREAGETIDAAVTAAPEGLFRFMLMEARAEVLLMRGEFEEARAAIASATPQRIEIGEAVLAPPRVATKAEIELWEGNPDAALRLIDQMFTVLTDAEWIWFSAPLYALAAQAYVQLAERARVQRRPEDAEAARAKALALRDRLDTFVGTPGWSSAYGPLLVAELTCFDGAGDPAAWRRARERFDEVGGRFRSAYCAMREAEALLAAGEVDRTAVRALLADAADYAEREGARGLANEIEALARRARLDLSSDAATAPSGDEEPTPAESAGLTPREAEVLSLVAEGRTNRQIAATLFISDKTASVHVSRILAKLGATNRSEAAAIARRLGV
ncbi:MAG: hypothetical protein QOH00_3073 [Gaiellales bacterium]|nr:hypothetical protein [Gaiellales bacterium]